MPFGLKNAGATYQRAMMALFHELNHKTLEFYVDDLVVKSKIKEDHVTDLAKVFERCRIFHLQMNPMKCAFGVKDGKFLGCVVHKQGIEPDPVKIKAVQEMPAPKNVKELKSWLEK